MSLKYWKVQRCMSGLFPVLLSIAQYVRVLHL